MVRPLENLSKRKVTGGRGKSYRERRAYERDNYPIETMVGEHETVRKRVRGGSVKMAVRHDNYANVADPSTKSVSKAKILRVISNPANRDYDRRRVITAGAIIETEFGRAKVSSRPSQHGVINAVLMK